MNTIETNAVLFFADYLSLKELSIPVTRPCKYFFVHNCPINAAYIADVFPDIDVTNIYYKRAAYLYILLKRKFGDDGVRSFIDGLCNILSSGMVDADRMLKYIHRYSTKQERKAAFKVLDEHLNNKKYFHTTINEQGNPQETECTQYVAHTEEVLKRRGIYKSLRINGETSEEPFEESFIPR